MKEMANFVVHLGFTPDAYWALQPAEREEIVKTYNAKVAAANRRR
ncbi:MAG TPA: hypothetical protein VFF10_09870 [Trueperaceae bacterium]|nr:hypothetical protein [Trueperaceae bacterium]